MKEQLAVSAAIIGASVVAAVVIAGGPSGIFPPDAAASLTITTDALFVPPLDEATPPADTSVPGAAPTSTATENPTTEPEQSASDRITTTEPGTSQRAGTPPPTTAGDELVARKDLVVAVANGAGVQGVATATAEQLTALGYVDPSPEDASSFPYTVVLFQPGMDGEASRLAEDAGLLATSTLAMGKSPDIGVTKTFDLVLVLGTDQRPTNG